MDNSYIWLDIRFKTKQKKNLVDQGFCTSVVCMMREMCIKYVTIRIVKEKHVNIDTTVSGD